MTTHHTDKLQRLLDRLHHPPTIAGATLAVAHGDQSWQGGAGNLSPDTPYFIASTTKLFVTTLVLQQVQLGHLSLEDPLHAFVPSDWLQGLHTYRGEDHARTITVRQLLAHTSGLPDYFQGKAEGERHSLLQLLTRGQDSSWDLQRVLAKTRAQRPRFAPGTPGKALYSDTNYQLLGHILTHVTGQTIAALYRQHICEPLGLQHTYLYTDPADTTPVPLRYRSRALQVPLAMASFGPDGGVVSTAQEQLRFIRAFYKGELFPANYLPPLMAETNGVMYPIRYGVGMMLFQLPRLFTLGWRMPALWGHSGLSGAFAFHCPSLDVSMAGTVNQIHSPGRSFRLMVRVLQLLGKA